MTTDRRTFIKLAAAAAAMVAAGGTIVSSVAAAARSRSRGTAAQGGVQWGKAPCNLCGVGCGVQVGVDGGRVVAVAGDPLAGSSQGLLCAKGYHAGMALYGADRLTTPLLRRNGRLGAISWDTAISIVADRVAMDPAGFAVYGSGLWTLSESYAVQKFMKGGLGNNNVDTSMRLSDASAVAGSVATYGADGPLGCYEDLDTADVIILWGNNAAEEHPVLFSRITDRRLRGETVTVIDVGSRRTRSTSAAQAFVRCRMSTEGAVVKGVLAILLREESWDKDFVNEHCSFRMPSDPPSLGGREASFEEWTAAITQCTPTIAQKTSEVREQDLRMLATLFGRRDAKIVSLWSEGVNQRAQGTAMNTLIHALHLLSGHFGKPGDGPMALSGQASACGSVHEVGASVEALPGGLFVQNDRDRADAEMLWNVPAGRIQAAPGRDALTMWSRFSAPYEGGGDVQTLWVQASNPAQTLPNRSHFFGPSREDRDKFLIVSDVYPTLTTEYADLVLPSAMWVEKNGMYGNLERRTQQWFKMVDPPGDARDDAWQTMAVAHALFQRGLPGMKDNGGRFLFDIADGVPIWDWPGFRRVNADRILFEEYRRFAELRKRSLAPYDAYVQARGLRWPLARQADGSYRETLRRFSAEGDALVTARSGFEFYRAASGDGRAQIWWQADAVPSETADAEYPFTLVTGAVLEHAGSGTITGRIPELRDAMPQGYLEMNRQDANRLQIADGETVALESRRGAIHIPVWIEGRGNPAPGALFVPIFDERLRVNALTLENQDPFSRQPELGACAVRVRRLVA